MKYSLEKWKYKLFKHEKTHRGNKINHEHAQDVLHFPNRFDNAL